MKYTFREPYILLKQYTSKQGFGNGHPEFASRKNYEFSWRLKQVWAIAAWETLGPFDFETLGKYSESQYKIFQ